MFLVLKRIVLEDVFIRECSFEVSSQDRTRFKLRRICLFFLFTSSWLTPLINKSHNEGTLNLSDLYDAPASFDANKLTDLLESNWSDELKRSPNNPSLIRTTIRTGGLRMFICGLYLIPMVNDDCSI